MRSGSPGGRTPSFDETLAADGDGTQPDGRDLDQQIERVGRFLVIEQIGSGGMGVVFAAYDPQLDRRVALKLVRSTRSDEAAKVRLLREAQGMARIAHPNVVAVFEAGTHGDAVWLAMELVEGGTLDDWLAAEGRGWREILACFVAAGRGLAAAHAAGLIHRDFKPENVLVSEDGRPQVADFGLVRATGSLEPSAGQSRPDIELEARELEPSRSAKLSESVTRVGALVGTPRYMAPEQLAGEDIGPHTDQFSFCVALYRALFGQAPFAGDTVMELLANVLDAEPRSPPRDADIPGPIVDAVMRGLARDPGARFASMDELLAALTPPPPRRGGLIALGVVAMIGVLLALALAFAAGGREEPSLCARGPERLAGVWDAEARAAVEQRFAALELAYGGEAFALVAGALDSWSGQWVEQYTDACEATHVRGDQSEAVLDLRMACLDRQRRNLITTTELLGTADAELVERAAELAASLPQPERCARLDELLAVAPPPPAQAEAVAEARAQLGHVTALGAGGRLVEAEQVLAELEAASAQLDYLPLLTELGLARARIAQQRGEAPALIDALASEAFARALEIGDEALALEIAVLLIRADTTGQDERRLALIERWVGISGALSMRRGQPPALELKRVNNHAWALSDISRYDAAIAQGQRAVELAERHFEPTDLRVGEAYLHLAQHLSNDSRYAEAMEAYQRASEVYEQTLGPRHPRLIELLLSRAMLANQIGDFEGASVDLLRMIELSEQVLGPNAQRTLDGLGSLGVSYDLSGDQARAREVFEEVLERIGEPELGQLRLWFETSNSLCFVLYKLGEYARGRSVCEAALLRTRGPAVGGLSMQQSQAILLNNLALIDRAEGQLELALTHDREALEVIEGVVGPEHAFVSYSLVGIGESLLMLGRAEQALEQLERALSLRERFEIPGELAEARCLLGRALLDAGEDEARGRELLERSLEGFAAGGKDWDARARSCEQWL